MVLMGYFLKAFLFKDENHPKVLFGDLVPRVIKLKQGISMVPILKDLEDQIGNSEKVNGFGTLSNKLEECALKISNGGLLAYVEAEFFGGLGSQSALAWENGERCFGPVHVDSAINQILKIFKVEVEKATDEFEAVGLGKHRKTEDWV